MYAIFARLPHCRANQEGETMSETKREVKAQKLELIKHSAAIQIQNNLTLLQRRAWNFLLWLAYDELSTQETHYIPIRELARLLEYDSHDEEYLKEALRALVLAPSSADAPF